MGWWWSGSLVNAMVLVNSLLIIGQRVSFEGFLNIQALLDWGGLIYSIILLRRQLKYHIEIMNPSYDHVHISIYYIVYAFIYCTWHQASVTYKTQNAHIQTKIAWWNIHVTCLLCAREIGKSTVDSSAWKSSIRRFVITEKAPTPLGPSPGWKRLLPLSHLRHY